MQVRAKPGAPVSAPCSVGRDRAGDGSGRGRFTLRTMAERVDQRSATCGRTCLGAARQLGRAMELLHVIEASRRTPAVGARDRVSDWRRHFDGQRHSGFPRPRRPVDAPQARVTATTSSRPSPLASSMGLQARIVEIYRQAQPNAVHHAIAALERAGKVVAVLTQNVDGLHRRAGHDAGAARRTARHRSHRPNASAVTRRAIRSRTSRPSGATRRPPTCALRRHSRKPPRSVSDSRCVPPISTARAAAVRKADLMIALGSTLSVVSGGVAAAARTPAGHAVCDRQPRGHATTTVTRRSRLRLDGDVDHARAAVGRGQLASPASGAV